MLRKIRLGQNARRLMLIPMALSALVLALWLAGAIPSTRSFLPAALLGLAGIGVMGATIVADAPRLPSDASRRLLEDEPAPERTRVLIVGASSSARRAAQEIESSDQHEVIGFVTDGHYVFPHDLLILGSTVDIPNLVRRLGIQQVIVAETPAW